MKRVCKSSVGAIALALTLGASSLTVQADQVGAPVKAVWQVQEVYFHYFGLTTFYSCDGMRDKVRDMLRELGAHESTLVSTAGCTELIGPDRLPGARIVLATPQPATADVVAAMAKDTKRAELLSKLARKGGPALETGEFNAVRKVATLNVKDPRSSNGAGDCELIEHVRDQIVKKMNAKILKDEVHCTPGQGVVGNRQLQVEVLVKS